MDVRKDGILCSLAVGTGGAMPGSASATVRSTSRMNAALRASSGQSLTSDQWCSTMQCIHSL